MCVIMLRETLKILLPDGNTEMRVLLKQVNSLGHISLRVVEGNLVQLLRSSESDQNYRSNEVCLLFSRTNPFIC